VIFFVCLCKRWNRVKSFGYAINPPRVNDSSRDTVVRELGKFVRVDDMVDAEVISTITDDNLHVIIDLMGYTHGAKERVLSASPAPLIIAWKGFMGSSGSNHVSLVTTDPITCTPELAPFFSEKFLYVRPAFFVSGHATTHPNVLDDPPSTLSRANAGLPLDAFVFGSFNTLYKIDPALWAVWMQILADVPNSASFVFNCIVIVPVMFCIAQVLWLLEEPDEARPYLHANAERFGISRDRIIMTPKSDLEVHIQVHARQRRVPLWTKQKVAKGDSVQVKGLADVILDTHVYNGHGTTGTACSRTLSACRSQPCQPMPSGLESLSSHCLVSTWPPALHRPSSVFTSAARLMPSKACSSSEISRSKHIRIRRDSICQRGVVVALLAAQFVLILRAGTMRWPYLSHAAAV
jgi:predicted O-linked N-acetylglucosamine transferase (SPINDLY family)